MKPKKKPPIRFDQVRELRGSAETGAIVRMSSFAKLMRDRGEDAAADELEREAKQVAPWCQGCGRKIDDPVVAIVGSGTPEPRTSR